MGNRELTFGAALAAVLFCGWLEYLSGPRVEISVFYVIPVVLTAWRFEAKQSVIVALAAVVTQLTAEASWHSPQLVGAWNALAWGSLLLGLSVTVSHARRLQDRVGALQGQVSDLEQLQRRLARTDPVTSLGNRRAFVDALQQAEARTRRTGGSLAVARLDIDRFTAFNDTYGRAQGDQALRAIATALALATRMGDLLARLDQDEYAVLLYACEPQDAAHVARRLIEQVAEVGRTYTEVPLTASVGVACFTRPGPDPDEMMRLAAIAQRQARSEGGGRVVLHIAGDVPTETGIDAIPV